MQKILVLAVVALAGSAFAQDGGVGGGSGGGGGPGSGGAQSFTYQTRGLTAYGSDYGWTGCGYSGSYVYANQSVNHSAGGAPTTSSDAWVYYYSYDWCAGSFEGGYGYGTGVNLAGNANQMTVSGTFAGWDWYLGSTSFTLNLTFTSTGSSYRGESTSSFTSPFGMMHSRQIGTSSQATVSGSLVVNGTDVLATNGAYSYAEITDSNSGTVTVIH